MLINKSINDVNKAICKNIHLVSVIDRGVTSQNILAQLRNFVEIVCLRIYSQGQNIDVSYENIQTALTFIRSQGKYHFIRRFHDLLQKTTSHYTPSEENAERLMLKYYEYLIRIKDFLLNNYNIQILENLDDFPLDIDPKLKEYYEKIAQKIEETIMPYQNRFTDRYYVQKIKPFFVNHKIYYEVTLSIANDNTSKFDRIIAFTKFDILSNYAIKISMHSSFIEILDKHMPVLIIDKWEVAIRPCEFSNLAKIFNIPKQIQSNSKEYKNLMQVLQENHFTLSEIIQLEDFYYKNIKKQILADGRNSNIFDILDICRDIIIYNRPGCNILKYLLFKLNNRIIKLQYSNEPCSYLSNLKLSYSTIPFDTIPFNTSLIRHNPRINDLLACIEIVGREDELFARLLKNNTEEKCQLYTHEDEIKYFKDLDTLISKYHKKLYSKHTHRKIEKYKNFYYINGYENDTIKILNILKNLTINGIANYSNSIKDWLENTYTCVDCEEKKTALINLFENSKIALIYGSAGTGKSTLINHISNFFASKTKLYLANTNPAVDNLKRKISVANSEFKTISSFTNSNRCNTEFDILIIDECSTVNNRDMLKILEKAQYKLLILVGDVYQIESIIFGNWFSVAKEFIPQTSVYELTKPFRTQNEQLISFWAKVRNLTDDILEIITKNNYSQTLNESLFEQHKEDEIILCLNYDGLYGINNVNRFLQESNPSKPIYWGIHTYKVNDPILFNETERFAPLLYNNLKGKIVKIEPSESSIQFDIELDKVINETDLWDYSGIELIDCSNDGKSTIRFSVSKYVTADDDDYETSDHIVPFQVAYAVSIHKAQGLEYSSVKIVITDELEEMITHNIFYTAVTRAKEELKIYWSPETEKKIFKNMKKRENKRDIALLKAKGVIN